MRLRHWRGWTIKATAIKEEGCKGVKNVRATIGFAQAHAGGATPSSLVDKIASSS